MSWQSSNRDRRDQLLVKQRVRTILDLVGKLQTNHYDKLDRMDAEDLVEAQKILQRISDRYKWVGT